MNKICKQNAQHRPFNAFGLTLRGFTLLEVMVALAIFATTALALMKIAMNYTQSIQQNELRTLAHFVAMNQAAELRIEQQWLTGSQSEDITEQGEQWRIQKQSFETMSPDVQRIDIQVSHINPDDAENVQGVTTLSVFNYRQPQLEGDSP
ncbi:type II secretion system protein I (GspI) [Acinetobacter marinus]|uniref:Type II secretion system protein I n=1 Tax=Acinetobacter marinus TaxID=281375 RepID=A0A1G6H0I4_9GAMM|nr:type II secretion system minor pseudopilin GspI [Acinetobacter marinus]SDB87810.1 type II secretion system protein I (GspI) [Acinetobacter marinus]